MRGGISDLGITYGKWRTGEPFRDSIPFHARARIRPSQVSTLHFAYFSKQKHKFERVYFFFFRLLLFVHFPLHARLFLPCFGGETKFFPPLEMELGTLFSLFLPRVYLDYFSFLVFLVFFLCLPHRSSANMGTRVWRRNGENPVRTGLPGDEAPQLKAVPNSIIPGKK